MELEFSKAQGPSFHYDPPKEDSYGDQPMIGNTFKYVC